MIPKEANLDVEIVVGRLALASHVDTAILVSGDGDLAMRSMLLLIAYKGIHVAVASFHSMTLWLGHQDHKVEGVNCR